MSRSTKRPWRASSTTLTSAGAGSSAAIRAQSASTAFGECSTLRTSKTPSLGLPSATRWNSSDQSIPTASTGPPSSCTSERTGRGRRAAVLMDQSSRDDPLVGIGSPGAAPAGAVSLQSSRDKHRKRSAGASSMEGEGRAISTTARELTVIQPGAAARSPEWHAAAAKARMLSWLSLAWMGAEGAIAIIAGVLAGSIALVSFGLDSAIEGFASLVIVWRFTGRRLLSHTAEGRAQKLVATQFFLLAPYVAFEAVHRLLAGERPETSWLGIALVSSSVIGMPFLGIVKRRLADQLGSVATRGEGTQNLLCAYLAAAVLVGLLGNTLFGLWWLDPAAALVVAAVAVKEGLASWRGEGCGCATC